MKYDPDFNHRQSIRLNGYDYSRSGAYFITICTHNRGHLFGDIVNETIELNTLGNLARSHWQQLSQYHPNIIMDESFAERTGGNRDVQSSTWHYYFRIIDW